MRGRVSEILPESLRVHMSLFHGSFPDMLLDDERALSSELFDITRFTRIHVRWSYAMISRYALLQARYFCPLTSYILRPTT